MEGDRLVGDEELVDDDGQVIHQGRQTWNSSRILRASRRPLEGEDLFSWVDSVTCGGLLDCHMLNALDLRSQDARTFASAVRCWLTLLTSQLRSKLVAVAKPFSM